MPAQTDRAPRLRVRRNRYLQRTAQDLRFEAAAERGRHEINLNFTSEIQPVTAKIRAAHDRDGEDRVARRTAIHSGMAAAVDDQTLSVPRTRGHLDGL